MKNLFSLLFIGAIAIALVLGCTGGANQNGTSTTDKTVAASSPAASSETTPAEKPIAIQAKALTKAYDENELSADGKYKGKVLAVSGKVSNIAETLGNVTVNLEGHNFVESVLCSFDEAERENVMKLKKGQVVTLLGTGDGSTGGLYVGMKECKVGT